MSAIVRFPRKSSISVWKLCAALCVVMALTIAGYAASEKVLYAFRSGQQHDKDGYAPNSTLVFDAAGNLYGTTEYGGIKNGGTAFELSPQPGGTWQETIIHFFSGPGGGGTDGFYPLAGMVFDDAGNLYGTTGGGGGEGAEGTVFELSPGTKEWTESVLHSFGVQAGDGQYPEAPVTLDCSGNLYGTTYMGRSPCLEGMVFQLAPKAGGWTENQLHCFDEEDGPDGAYVIAGVTFDTSGNLYGTTYLGGSGNGVVYELSPGQGAWTENILYTFGQNAWHPGGPYAGVIFDKEGNLYGTDPFGGSAGYGSVYELKNTGQGWEEITLYSFQDNGEDGVFPENGNLVFDNVGNLYGTTGGGGSGGCRGLGCGTVFELSPTKDGWQETILYSFRGGSDGSSPAQGLVLDSKGNLYGTTTGGGKCKLKSYGCGTVFEITP